MSRHRIRICSDCIRDKLAEFDLDKRNSTSNVRSDDKVVGRCMEKCCQCTGDMPTEPHFPPVYGPSCGTMSRLCAHTAVERQESVALVVAKPIETKWFRIVANLRSSTDRARAIKMLIVSLRSAFANGWVW